MFTAKFKNITSAATNNLNSWRSSLENANENTLAKITDILLSLKENCSSLLLHWCHILKILNFTNQSWWKSLYAKESAAECKSDLYECKWTHDIAQKGSLLVFCDSLADYFKVGAECCHCFIILSFLHSWMSAVLRPCTPVCLA